MAHRTHITINAPEDMIIAEPRKPYYATDIRSMTSCNERLHGCYLIVELAEQVTIIITRACVIIGIDQSPMPEQRICLGESKTVVIQPAFVHTQAVGHIKSLTSLIPFHT